MSEQKLAKAFAVAERMAQDAANKAGASRWLQRFDGKWWISDKPVTTSRTYYPQEAYYNPGTDSPPILEQGNMNQDSKVVIDVRHLSAKDAQAMQNRLLDHFGLMIDLNLVTQSLIALVLSTESVKRENAKRECVEALQEMLKTVQSIP
jgi:hypothetical protein